MKLLVATLCVLLLAGCTSRTEFGPCIGLADDKDPKLIYKVSGWNIAMGIIFIEMIVPPILVATDETFCPIGKKENSNDNHSNN